MITINRNHAKRTVINPEIDSPESPTVWPPIPASPIFPIRRILWRKLPWNRIVSALQLHKPDSVRVHVETLQGEFPVGCLRWMADLLSQTRLPDVHDEARQPQPDQNHQREVGPVNKHSSISRDHREKSIRRINESYACDTRRVSRACQTIS
jgi:hypothetical protein